MGNRMRVTSQGSDKYVRLFVFIFKARVLLVDQRLMLIGEHPIAIRPLKLLFSQQTGC